MFTNRTDVNLVNGPNLLASFVMFCNNFHLPLTGSHLHCHVSDLLALQLRQETVVLSVDGTNQNQQTEKGNSLQMLHPPLQFHQVSLWVEEKGKCEEVAALPVSLPSTRCGSTAQEAAPSWSCWRWSWGRGCARPGRLQQEKEPLGSEDPRELRVETEDTFV